MLLNKQFDLDRKDYELSYPVTTLHDQIYERFRSQIEQGRLRPGQRVASLRAMAMELGVARGTVQVAYDRLVGEGYLVARGPAGTFVSDSTPLLRQRPSRDGADGAAGNTATMACFRAMEHDESLALGATGVPPTILQPGYPALDEFPHKVWARLIGRQARRITTLLKPALHGYAPLRDALAGHLNRARGLDVEPSQVFVVPCYASGLELAFTALKLAGEIGRESPSDVWVECPGFPTTAVMVERLNARPCHVPVDQQGINVGMAAQSFRSARVAIVTPSHQSPTGVSLALPRRVALLNWARTNRAWIFEDDYDGEYRFRGHPLPALKALDNADRVIYAGTMSKVMFPGMRIAYIVAPKALVTAFAQASQRAVYGGCPELMQAALAEFIEQGHFSRHIKRMRALYARRRTLLVQALRRHSDKGYSVTLESGGMNLLLDVPEGEDDVELAHRARKAGIEVFSLTAWRKGKAGRRALLLGYTNITSAEQAEAQVTALMRALQPAA
ncbi:GntR family transcriptional regulator [Cupriavidus plantarum]|nr:PLP-dependent aminotransferase family protein [Cupriavidus pauculus]QET04028.1 PLP-dependent aminotransferase family protein [Cupriavidus pauculus]RLK31780.1 GntR family transcriptional regulator [Cupriavidus plantarum]